MNDTRPHITVAAGVLHRGDEVLIAQRLPGTHGAGLWEFPGGKQEPGELIWQTLVRELYEELGIVVTQKSPLTAFEFDYPERHISFRFFRVSDWRGAAHGVEGQALEWCAVADLHNVDWLPANRDIAASVGELLSKY